VAPLLAPAALSLMAYFFVRALVVVGVVSVLVRARDVAAFAAVADAGRGRVDEACALVVALSIVVVVVVALRSAVTGQRRDTAWLF
jgi:ABC-type Fe3+ transport system permease subunit